MALSKNQVRTLRKVRRISGTVVGTILKLLVCVIFGFPFLWMIATSFKTNVEAIQFPPTLLPEKFVFDAYITVFTKLNLGKYIGNSVIILILVTIGQMLVMVPAAYAFAKYKFKGNGLLFGFLMVAFMVPTAITYPTIAQMFMEADLIQTLIPQIVPCLCNAFGINVTSLIALLSVAGLAVSLALQNTLSNLAGGIMVLLSKPFEVGDFVESEGITGTVAGVDLAYTTIVTVDNKEVFVPNSHISAAKIINYNRLGKRRVDLNFTASYDAPTATVKKAIQEVVDAQSSMILTDPAPVVLLSAYLNSSIQYTVRVWVDAADYWTVYGNINEGVRESFARNNVEMTYDHVNVHLVKE